MHFSSRYTLKPGVTQSNGNVPFPYFISFGLNQYIFKFCFSVLINFPSLRIRIIIKGDNTCPLLITVECKLIPLTLLRQRHNLGRPRVTRLRGRTPFDLRCVDHVRCSCYFTFSISVRLPLFPLSLACTSYWISVVHSGIIFFLLKEFSLLFFPTQTSWQQTLSALGWVEACLPHPAS